MDALNSKSWNQTVGAVEELDVLVPGRSRPKTNLNCLFFSACNGISPVATFNVVRHFIIRLLVPCLSPSVTNMNRCMSTLRITHHGRIDVVAQGAMSDSTFVRPSLAILLGMFVEDVLKPF